MERSGVFDGEQLLEPLPGHELLPCSALYRFLGGYLN